jgi:DHA2 family multidrug resistance protein-like MFS transporter
MHMVIVSYVLTVAVMLPASGWLADRVGVRNIFTAIVLFTAGSLFCAQANTLDQLVMARVLQGVGGAMMVPVGRLTVMKIVPRDQYMAAMTFVTLPGQVGPLLGPALGGVLVEYASWHWIFLINLPVGIVGAIATLVLMPNYTMQTRRFDFFGFMLLAAGMATLTLALDGQKGLGISPDAGILVALGVCPAVVSVACPGNDRALFSLNLFRNRTYLSAWRQLCRTHRQRHAAVYDAGVSADWPGLFAVSRRADDDPDGARQHGHEAHRGAGGEPLWLPSRAGAATLGLALVSLLFMVALMGWYYVLPLVLFCRG